MPAWQYLTAGGFSCCICLLLLIDLIRENAHHSFTTLSAVIIEVCNQVVKTASVQKESFLLAAKQALSHICKGYKSERNVIWCSSLIQTWFAWNAV